MSEQWIIVRNWEKFQHRDATRNAELGVPIWTKVYTRLLFDDHYIDISLTEKGALHLVWLLFAASDGQLSVNRVTARGPLSVSRSLLDSLNQAGFIGFSASKPLRLSASLEKNREEKNREETVPAAQTKNGPPREPSPYAHHHGPQPERARKWIDNGLALEIPEVALRRTIADEFKITDETLLDELVDRASQVKARLEKQKS